MSYTIEYGPSKMVKKKQRNRILILPLIAAVLIPTLIVAARTNKIQSGSAKTALFPWEQEYVQEAFSDFSDSVRTGDDFLDAAAALYKQIMHAEETAQ